MSYVSEMKLPVMFGKGIIIGVVRLALPADLDHPRWCEIGADLRRFDRAVAWWVGDWWAFGEHRYGARREITENPGWQGPAYPVVKPVCMLVRPSVGAADG